MIKLHTLNAGIFIGTKLENTGSKLSTHCTAKIEQLGPEKDLADYRKQLKVLRKDHKALTQVAGLGDFQEAAVEAVLMETNKLEAKVLSLDGIKGQAKTLDKVQAFQRVLTGAPAPEEVDAVLRPA